MSDPDSTATQQQNPGFRLCGVRSHIADMLRSIGQIGTGGVR